MYQNECARCAYLVLGTGSRDERGRLIHSFPCPPPPQPVQPTPPERYNVMPQTVFTTMILIDASECACGAPGGCSVRWRKHRGTSRMAYARHDSVSRCRRGCAGSWPVVSSPRMSTVRARCTVGSTGERSRRSTEHKRSAVRVSER
jgi:hypothetical protein